MPIAMQADYSPIRKGDRFMQPKSIQELNLRQLTQRGFTPSPAAWEDQVLYFLMVDRFHDDQPRASPSDFAGHVTPPLPTVHRRIADERPRGVRSPTNTRSGAGSESACVSIPRYKCSMPVRRAYQQLRRFVWLDG